jgi:hypothetical protein
LASNPLLIANSLPQIHNKIFCIESFSPFILLPERRLALVWVGSYCSFGSIGRVFAITGNNIPRAYNSFIFSESF